MKKIVIWAAGQRMEHYCRDGIFDHCEIVGIVDREKWKTHETIGEHEIQPTDKAKTLLAQADYLVIATVHFEEVYVECLQMGIPRDKIVITDCVDEPVFAGNMERVRSISEKLYQRMLRVQYQLVKRNEKDASDTKRRIPDPPFDDKEYRTDYFRYRTFEFVAEDLIDAGVEGDIAEFGVFRALFSALIMEKLPERKMYWFDTFEGFSEAENEKETKLGRSNPAFFEGHKKTSVERALGNVAHPEKVVVCKGLFPASITKEAEQARFAFVSIDVDFEDSTYEGLKFFYPRLNDGGCIFLHDYNSAFLGGVRAAVKRYEKNFGVKFKAVPLADRAGTLVIVK